MPFLENVTVITVYTVNDFTSQLSSKSLNCHARTSRLHAASQPHGIMAGDDQRRILQFPPRPST